MAEPMGDGGWAEVDISKARKASSSVEKVEYEKPEEDIDTVEAELEAGDDSNDTEEDTDTSNDEESTPEELEGIETKGAEKRIRQLVQQRRERDAMIEEMKAEMERMRSAIVKGQKTTKTYEMSSLTSQEEGLKERIKLAESQYLTAYDNGDKEKLLEAQNILSDAKTDLKILQLRKNQIEKNNPQTSKDDGDDSGYETPEPQRTQPTTRQYSGPDPLAMEWAENNPWFGKDETLTMVAMGLDQKLKNEGFDPTTKEFYNEIDKLLRKEFPHKFKRGTGNTAKPSQVVAGSSRNSTPGSAKSKSNKVRLTERDVALAKKWGIPLDRYAQEKKRLESVEDSYTAINVNRV